METEGIRLRWRNVYTSGLEEREDAVREREQRAGTE